MHSASIAKKSAGSFMRAWGREPFFGVEPLDGIVNRTAFALGKPALAAINGDFFEIKQGPYQGDPRGIQIVEGELVSRPTGNAFWVAADGSLNIGRVASKLRVVWPDGKTETAIGLNEARAEDAIVLYTPTLCIRANDPPKQPEGTSNVPLLGTSSVWKTDYAPHCFCEAVAHCWQISLGDEITGMGTRTQGGKELVLERVAGQPWLPIRVAATYSAKIAEIRDGGDTPISADRMILSIGPKKLPLLPTIRSGDTLQLILQTEPDLKGVTTAIGAGRILMRDGKLPEVGPEFGKRDSPIFVDHRYATVPAKIGTVPRHPRSMIGWNRQYLFFIVIDGRQPEISIGMAYPEMAALAKQYECTDAIELDGGGSSTLWALGKTLNSPSDGKPRAIANGLILFKGSEGP
jgi:hypothetical protein